MLVVLVTNGQWVGKERLQAEVSDLEVEAAVDHAVGGAKSAVTVYRRVMQEFHRLLTSHKIL